MCKDCKSFNFLENMEIKFNCDTFREMGACDNKDSDHFRHVLFSDHPKCICHKTTNDRN